MGLDVLSESSFHVDYRTKRIDFGDVSDEGIPVPYDPRTGIAVATLQLGGKSVRMLVDTGSDRVVLLGGNFRDVRWLGLQNSSQSGKKLAYPELQEQVFPAEDIVLSGQRFRKKTAYFIPGSADPAFDGLLGVRALGFPCYLV